MKMIEEISNRIEEEMEDAKYYAKQALFYKEKNKELAEMYYTLSMDETKHSNILHVQGVKIIDEYKRAGNVVPESMIAVYEYLHKKHIEKTNEVKGYQNSFRE